jgi:hypothetical protein
MCDYSLMGVPNRLARQDEELVVHRFHTGTMGMTSVYDMPPLAVQSTRTLWEKVKDLFTDLRGETICAVCVPPGAQLLLLDIPQRMQREFCVGRTEQVKFTQTGLDANTHRDGVTFANGRTLLLQSLPEGQRVRVLSISSEEAPTPVPEHFETMSRR